MPDVVSIRKEELRHGELRASVSQYLQERPCEHIPQGLSCSVCGPVAAGPVSADYLDVLDA